MPYSLMKENESLMERLDVTHVRPLESNSALRYLWARHRITLLADYNRLSPQDERVREVTSLGLTYNLLTTYTSFIAVDTKVRRVDGKTVTVKQPLPLPQGVSDLAVGNRMYAKSRAQAFAGAPLAVTEQSAPGKGWPTCKDEKFGFDKAISKKLSIELRKIVVSEGMAESSVKTLIERAMPVINNCYRAASGQESSPKGEVVFTLVVGPDGRVTKGYMEKSKSRYKAFEHCIVRRLKALQFPAKAGRKDVVIKITFILR